MKTGLNTAGVIAPIVFAALFVGAFSGCQYRSYQEGQTKYTSISFGTTQQVAPFKLEAGKEGDATYRKLESKGLSNDPSAAIEAAVTAAVRAAKTP